MKIFHYIFVSCLFFSAITGYAQQGKPPSKDSTTAFKVFGVCEQCKHRIEESLKVKGVKRADWNIETKMLSLTYDPSKISIEKIHNKIAAAGHDTYIKKANDAVYKALPKCCYYREMESMDETTPITDTANFIQQTDSAMMNQSATDYLVKGVVLEGDSKGSFKPLSGANVVWSGTNTGTTTDENGVFSLRRNGERLVISYAGFTSDTISVIPMSELKIVLATGKQLNEVKVTSLKPSTFVNSYDAFRTQTMTQKELFKAACCNLSESFETNPAVDVSFNDAVTGSKQIQLLGLAGIYTQLTVENLPGPRGLATSLGLNSIPGTFIESIQLNKGTGSVANGYESIAGQINVELKKPASAEKLFANIYANDFGKADINLNLTQNLGKKWATTFLLHNDNYNNKKLDFNKDGFRDLPTGNLFSGVNRWSYDNSKGLMSQFGIKYLNDNKTGGQIGYDASKDKFTTNNYGLEINTRRIEGFAKIGYVFPEKNIKALVCNYQGLIINRTLTLV